MNARLLQIGISIAAILIAIVHIILPNLAIDGITVTLLLVALLPWLAPLFKSVELPGGVKVEFQELEQAEQRAEHAGLLAPENLNPDFGQYSFQSVAENDPNLALAGLRIEIEKRLQQIARSKGIEEKSKGLGRLIRILTEKHLLTGEEGSVLADMIGLLNSAVHGADVDPRAASWAMSVGPRLLQSLDQRALP